MFWWRVNKIKDTPRDLYLILFRILKQESDTINPLLMLVPDTNNPWYTH